MNVTRALQRAVKNFRLGTQALAVAMGVSSDKVLLAKVNPERTETHCSPREMLQIMEITGDHSALFEMADEMGYVLIKNPLAGAEVGECAKHLVDSVREFGAFIETVSASAADGVVTLNERKEVAERCARAQAEIIQLDAFIGAKHEAGKPSHLRIA